MTASEFGRGYATCLRQFTFHRARLEEDLTRYAEHRKNHGDLFSEESAVEIWANGSSDHLYELVRPRRGVPKSEWERAKALGARAIHIGHGFQATSKSDPQEAVGLLDAADELLVALERRGHQVDTLAEAMETDRALGLSPEAGEWSCVSDIHRKSA
jgi:hypothetical protein